MAFKLGARENGNRKNKLRKHRVAGKLGRFSRALPMGRWVGTEILRRTSAGKRKSMPAGTLEAVSGDSIFCAISLRKRVKIPTEGKSAVENMFAQTVVLATLLIQRGNQGPEPQGTIMGRLRFQPLPQSRRFCGCRIQKFGFPPK